jgi:hypothetical protein
LRRRDLAPADTMLLRIWLETFTIIHEGLIESTRTASSLEALIRSQPGIGHVPSMNLTSHITVKNS